MLIIDKIKAVLLGALVTGLGGAVAALAGADWAEVFQEFPGPDALKAVLVVAVVNLLGIAGGYFKSETGPTIVSYLTARGFKVSPPEEGSSVVGPERRI